MIPSVKAQVQSPTRETSWFEDKEVVPAFSPPTDSLTSQQLRQSVCTGGDREGEAQSLASQSVADGRSWPCGGHWAGAAAAVSLQGCEPGRGWEEPGRAAALSRRSASVRRLHLASLALPSDVLNTDNHRRRTVRRHRFTDDPSTPKK